MPGAMLSTAPTTTVSGHVIVTLDPSLSAKVTYRRRPTGVVALTVDPNTVVVVNGQVI